MATYDPPQYFRQQPHYPPPAYYSQPNHPGPPHSKPQHWDNYYAQHHERPPSAPVAVSGPGLYPLPSSHPASFPGITPNKLIFPLHRHSETTFSLFSPNPTFSPAVPAYTATLSKPSAFLLQAHAHLHVSRAGSGGDVEVADATFHHLTSHAVEMRLACVEEASKRKDGKRKMKQGNIQGKKWVPERKKWVSRTGTLMGASMRWVRIVRGSEVRVSCVADQGKGKEVGEEVGAVVLMGPAEGRIEVGPAASASENVGEQLRVEEMVVVGLVLAVREWAGYAGNPSEEDSSSSESESSGDEEDEEDGDALLNAVNNVVSFATA